MDKKQCPKCKALAPLAAQTCIGCGHIFRTSFADPLDKTQMVSHAPSTLIPPPNQPQFDPYQAQNISQGVADAGKGIKWTPWAILGAAALLITPCIAWVGVSYVSSIAESAALANRPRREEMRGAIRLYVTTRESVEKEFGAPDSDGSTVSGGRYGRYRCSDGSFVVFYNQFGIVDMVDDSSG